VLDDVGFLIRFLNFSSLWQPRFIWPNPAARQHWAFAAFPGPV